MDEIAGVIDYIPDETEDYYAILGCDELSSSDQIVAEYKARVLACHPDKHPGNEAKAKDFEKIQTAKDVLCDTKKRELYDKWRHAGICVPFRRWCNMRDAVHTLMKPGIVYWGYSLRGFFLNPEDSPCPAGLGIASNNEKSKLDNVLGAPWVREQPSQMLRKFRNYEI